MPEKKGKKKASTRAGKYVREEMHHMREGKHPVKNRKLGNRNWIVEGTPEGS